MRGIYHSEKHENLGLLKVCQRSLKHIQTIFLHKCYRILTVFKVETKLILQIAQETCIFSPERDRIWVCSMLMIKNPQYVYLER